MSKLFGFTFFDLEQHLKKALELGYTFMTCEDYVKKKKNLPKKVIVNRVDIDLSVIKAEKICNIFNKHGIKATFFIRLHEGKYNPFSFHNYKIIKFIIKSGHEVGYHSEVIAESKIWGESAESCLKKDIYIINKMFDIKISGIASHGYGTVIPINNLDFWKNNDPKRFGLLYEAYDTKKEFNLFKESFYISDSEYSRWKCYSKGKIQKNDYRDLTEHLRNNHKLIYLLIHPETYYENNPFEEHN